MNKEEQINTLKEKVKLGNQKLNLAWDQICKIDHESQRWNDEVERWHQANEKLSLLCMELEGLGFVDCLYLENGKKTRRCLPPVGLSCRVCPSIRRYWETELMSLPSPRKNGNE